LGCKNSHVVAGYSARNNSFIQEDKEIRIWEHYIVPKLSMLTKTSPIIPESLLWLRFRYFRVCNHGSDGGILPSNWLAAKFRYSTLGGKLRGISPAMLLKLTSSIFRE
jgi:hypothetical protein